MLGYVIIGLNVLVTIIFIYFIFKSKNKWKGLIHYETIRDKLTLRTKPKPKPVEEPEEKYTGFGFSLGNLIGGFIVIIVGINLIPTVVEEVQSATNSTITTPAMQGLMDLVPLVFIFGAVALGLSVGLSYMKRSGLV